MQNVWDQTSHKQLAAAAKMLFPNNLLGSSETKTHSRPGLVSTMFMLQFLGLKEPQHINEMQR